MASAFRRGDFDADPVPVPAYSIVRPLTAAATRMSLDDATEAERFKLQRNSQTAVWQSAAWEYYDAIGEIKFAFNLVSSIVSRIRLFVAINEDPAEAPIDVRKTDATQPDLVDAATRALARLNSAYGGQAGLLRDASLNLSVTGECYLVQVPARPGHGTPETWDIRSTDELKVDNQGNYFIVPRRDLAGGNFNKPGIIPLPKNAFVGRIWRAHPRFSEEPDSSLRGLLDLCDELLLLNRTYRATHRSRLNAGLLYIPDGLATAGRPDPDLPFSEDMEDLETPEEAEDSFEEELLEAMSTPIANEASASAVVPLLVRGPVDLGKEIKHIKFERSFEDSMNARYDRVLERILQGLDVPKDTVTGLANVKYSNAIQIDEALYKAHIEPMLLLFCDAVTVIFLRPYLKSQGFPDAEVDRLVVWYDPSSVATRNDRAADADSGYEKMAISAETWRRAHGFSDADAPTPNEVTLRLLKEKGAFTPELTEALLTVIAPDIMQAVRAAQQASSVAPIPDNVAQALSGQPGAPVEEAPADEAAEPDSTNQGEDGTVPSEGTPAPAAAPGEDGPPFPLAEPGNVGDQA